MKAAAFDFYRARDVGDALAALASHSGDAMPLAGGCSLGPMLNLRLARPTLLVDLSRIAEMRQLARSGRALLIGACRTHAEIEDGIVPEVTGGFMRHVAHRIAYRAVRNRGTIGGSLAHADPAADWITALVALDAAVVIATPNARREQAVSGFMLGAYVTQLAENEIIIAVLVPTLSTRARWAYRKICRKTGEFAQSIGAAILDPERDYARVVCGAIEAPPVVLPNSSALLFEKGTEAARREAPAEIADLLAGRSPTNLQLHQVAVDRALCEMTEP